jgi:hypothetical protein
MMDECPLCSAKSSNPNLTVDTLTGFNEPIVQIHEEPSHRQVLQSASIRVFDVCFLPNEVSLFHSHEKDSVLVCLDGADVTNELPGQGIIPRPPIPSGEIYYRPYATKPLVHRIRNQGTTTFRILDIEVLKAVGSAMVLPSLPTSFVTVLENERVRVSKLSLAPDQCTDEITFVSPRILVITRAGKIAISSGAQTQAIQAKRGFLNMQEVASNETIKNMGNTEVEIVIVEAK